MNLEPEEQNPKIALSLKSEAQETYLKLDTSMIS